MSIKGYENFTYEGYTLGGEKPTLYFKEGRYTQVHESTENVGWHPLNTVKCYRVNITDEAEKVIMEIPEGDPNESKFALEVVAGKYTAKAGKGILCECYTNDDKQFVVHVSRGRLIRPSDFDFDKTYDAKYAKDVLAKGVLAPNEV